MSSLPVSLLIAIWLVAASWLVGLSVYLFGFSSDIVWLVLCAGTGTAIVEWRTYRDRRMR
jgi:hypothetical protein